MTGGPGFAMPDRDVIVPLTSAAPPSHRVMTVPLAFHACWAGWLATLAILTAAGAGGHAHARAVHLVTALWTLLWAGAAWGISERAGRDG